MAGTSQLQPMAPARNPKPGASACPAPWCGARRAAGVKSSRHAIRDRRLLAPALSALPRRAVAAGEGRRRRRSVPRCPGVSRLNLFHRRIPALSRRIPPCPGESRLRALRRRPSVPRTDARNPTEFTQRPVNPGTSRDFAAPPCRGPLLDARRPPHPPAQPPRNPSRRGLCAARGDAGRDPGETCGLDSRASGEGAI